MAKEVLAWTDVESTGIDPDENVLLEVACIITDTDLNVLDEQGFQRTVYFPTTMVEALKSRANEYVVDMHTSTGLWDRLPNGTPLSLIDEEFYAYLTSFAPEPRTAWLGGNSITLDRNFLGKYLPKTFGHLHYRSVDVTSWAGPAQWWYKGLQLHKKTLHNALSDIQESIQELKFLRENMLQPQGVPGVSYKPKQVTESHVSIAGDTFNMYEVIDSAAASGLSPTEYAEHVAKRYLELAKYMRNQED